MESKLKLRMKAGTIACAGALALVLMAPLAANAQQGAGRAGGGGGAVMTPPTSGGGGASVGGGGRASGGGAAVMGRSGGERFTGPRSGGSDRLSQRRGGDDRITGSRTDRRVVTGERRTRDRTAVLGEGRRWDGDGRRWRGRDGRWRYWRPGIGVTFYDSSYYSGNYDTAYYYDRGDWTEDALDRCEEAFRSFDRRTGTYVTYEGETKLCPYLR